jgi:hypothetical protein
MPVRKRVRIHRRLQVTRGWQRSRAGSAGLGGLLELAVLTVSDVSGAVKLNTRQGIDARFATLTTHAKAGQASWCSGEDWILRGA